MTEKTSYTPVYAVKSRIMARLSFLNQPPKDDLLYDSMEAADDTVNSRLTKNNLPTLKNGDDIPKVLQTAANYYALSDILQSIYGKDDRSSNEEGYYYKAESLVNDYIQQKLVELEGTEGTTLDTLSPYGISQSPDAFDLGLIHR